MSQTGPLWTAWPARASASLGSIWRNWWRLLTRIPRQLLTTTGTSLCSRIATGMWKLGGQLEHKKEHEAFYCLMTSFFLCRTWDTWDIPDMGPNQSIFISTWAKGQTPFILNIGCFLALGATCLSCPLRFKDCF